MAHEQEDVVSTLTMTEKNIMIIGEPSQDPQRRNGNVDIISLFNLISVAIDEYIKIMQVPKEYQAKFYKEYPATKDGKFDTRYNVITGHIKKRLRGNTARTGARDRRPRKATFIRTADDNTNPGHKVITMSKWMENHIAFEVCSKNKKDADHIALWLENMMEVQRHFLLLAGVKDYTFLERTEDKKEKILDTELYTREIVYEIITEETYYYHVKTIESISLDYTIAQKTNVIEVDGKKYKIYG